MPHRGNLLLASLSLSDLAAIQPDLKLAHFEQDQVLFEAGDSIDATYFPTSAVISIVVGLSSGQLVEAAMVGRDGVVARGRARWQFLAGRGREDHMITDSFDSRTMFDMEVALERACCFFRLAVRNTRPVGLSPAK